MSANPHVVLLASAGTGKTYRLSVRFLALLFDGVEPTKILATTFTRKAAGEILQRILERLCDAAEGGEGLARLQKDVPGRRFAAADCQRVLRALLASMERLRVGTLDAFFAGVARAYALDLGLPSTWAIVDEETASEMKSDALAEALTEAEPGEIGALLAALHQDAAKRAVHAALFAAIESGRGLFLESSAEAWDRLRVPKSPSDEMVGAAIAALERLPVPKTKKGEENQSWVKARRDLVAVARDGDWERLVELGLVSKVLAGESEYYKLAIPPEWVTELLPLIDRARSVILAALARENRASRAWFARFEASLARLARERGAVRFEDLPLAIAPLAGDPLAARGIDLWFRLDGKVDHVLLDEFQDTSPPQWRCLEPVAEELFADGSGSRSFFCVGDVKQSIYGWRGAEPRLLESLPRRYPVLGKPEVMLESWRSSQVVLDAVNAVFASIATSTIFDDKYAKYAPAARRFAERFGPHTARKVLTGAAVLLEARAHDEAKGEKKHVPLCELTLKRVVALHAEAPEARIAVLLRRNKWIPLLVRGLAERGIRASGEGGNPLTDSAAVVELCALLLLSDHPGDSARAFHVAHSPLAPLLDVAPGDDDRAREAALEARRALAAIGYGRWLAALHARMRSSASHGTWDLERFGQLVELGFAFDMRATLRPGDFARHVARARVEDPSTARVKLMTVHAAKGLEFDAVICPELDGLLSGRTDRFDWERDEPDGAVTFVSRHVDEVRARLDPNLEALAQAGGTRRVEESLSLLYVAMTRAIHRLELIVPWRAPDANPTLTCAGVLRAALGSGPADERGVLWEHAENATPWFVPEARAARREITADEEQHESPVPLDLFPGSDSRIGKGATTRASERQSATRTKLGPVLAAATLLRVPDRFGTARGTLVHRWLAEIEWLDSPHPTDARLRELARGHEHDERVIQAALADFRAALARPPIAALLARRAPATGDELVVWRERPFALHLPDDDGIEVLWQGAFDRVVLTRRANKWLSAELLDWKNDHVSGAELAERTEHYRPQLAAYRRVLARQTGLPEAAIATRLAFLHTGHIADQS